MSWACLGATAAALWPRLRPCRRRLGLGFSDSRAIKSVHQGGVTWLDLDHVEHRYLLAGAADASIAVYDMQQTPAGVCDPDGDGSGGGGGNELQAVLHITKQSPGGHRYSVSSVAWYPVDTGLFVTGGSLALLHFKPVG